MAPDELELPKPRLKLIGIFLIGAIFAALGVGMLLEGLESGWIALFLGSAAPMALWMWFGGAGVRLDRQGFEANHIWTKHRRAWREVSEFSVVRMRGAAFIVFDLVGAPKSPLGHLNSVLTGRSQSISSGIIGGSIREACETMNSFRARALREGR